MKSILFLCLALVLCGCEKKPQVSTIEYQGEKFRLNKPVGDYEEFKETENNLHPEELKKVEAKVMSVKIAKEFNSKAAFILAAIKIKIPGYNFGALSSAGNVHTATIEIPGTGKARYITAVEKKGRWVVVADFVASANTGGTSVCVEGKEVVFRNFKGQELARRKAG